MKQVNRIRETITRYNDTEYVSTAELITVLLGRSAKPEIVEELNALGRDILHITVNELMEMGLTEIKAIEFQSAIELAKRLIRFREDRYAITSPKDAANYLMNEMSMLKQEHLVALFLNVKNEVIGKKTIFIGGLNSSIVHPRELFKEAIKVSAASIIISHNHPSGNPNPSPEDIEITKRIVSAGKIVGIELLDHVIIGDGNFSSLKEKGYI